MGQFEGNSKLSGSFRPCKMRVHKQTQSILSDCTQEEQIPCCMLEPHASESIAPRLYNHLSKSAFAQMERRTACHFTETNVQKRIKPKTISSSLLSRALLCCSVPKKQIRLKGADVPSCLCVILRRVIITICSGIKVNMFLSVPMPSLSFLFLSPSISMVQPSHWVHVSWQRLADSGPKEEKRGEWITALDLNLFSPVVLVGPDCPSAFPAV